MLWLRGVAAGVLLILAAVLSDLVDLYRLDGDLDLVVTAVGGALLFAFVIAWRPAGTKRLLARGGVVLLGAAIGFMVNALFYGGLTLDVQGGIFRFLGGLLITPVLLGWELLPWALPGWALAWVARQFLDRDQSQGLPGSGAAGPIPNVDRKEEVEA